MSTVEKEFIFDAVVGFLTSPIWNFPVRTFIEQNSLVFDPDGENHEEYQKIHSSYKSMVESLLSSFLKDVGITEEQFMTACKDGSRSPQFSGINREVFEQMCAADNYEVFKQLMIQKNIQLQLQALQIIQQIHNVQMPMPMPVPVAVPPMAAPIHGALPPPAGHVDEDAIMQEVLRRSKEEYESQQKKGQDKELQEAYVIAQSKEESERLIEKAKKEQEELERALQISLENQKQQAAEAETLRDEVKQSTVKPSSKPPEAESKEAAKTSPVETKPAPKTSPVESKPTPKPTPAKAKSPTQDTKPPEKSKTTGLPPLSGQPKKAADTASDAAAGWIQSAKDDAAASSVAKPAQTQEISQEEMKRRTEYLKQQRDKLLALKRQEREKSLTKYTEKQPKARPTTSRAARRVTAGEQVESPPAKSSEEDAKKLAMRRALADCLKREVIDKD